MFQFWSSKSRGSEKTTVDLDNHHQPSEPQLPTPDVSSPPDLKRRRHIADHFSADAPTTSPPAKRARHDHDSAIGLSDDSDAAETPCPTIVETVDGMERMQDAIQYQLGFEILLKHNELRLINQELAKCQVALEQLRRCHLIPYPINCPTPEQMLEISNGKGPALQRTGEAVPQWAPPFGVVDGPYARHYAKWLIPDPKFDGLQADWHPQPEFVRSRSSLEGRSTRNSVVDLGGFASKRSGRGLVGQKLQALSTGYPQPKEKAGPCILKRADGKTVKLVCIDCHRDNFSSTQGFINHCRIAHKRDFKSHEEAAVACGHPIEPAEAVATPSDEKPAPAVCSAPLASGLVHPFARGDMTDQQAYRSLLSRIEDSLKLYHQGKLPGVTRIPSIPQAPPAEQPSQGGLIASSEVPYLSRLMQEKNLCDNLHDLVTEAKKDDLFEDVWSPDDDSEDMEPSSAGLPNGSLGARGGPVMRMPARTAMMPSLASVGRPVSSKGCSPHMSFAGLPTMSMLGKESESRLVLIHDEDVDMDVDLSPNTMVSNNAPSLVSDDDDYDDSDDASSMSGRSDSLEAESVSDIAEINIDEDHDPRSPRHHRGSASTAVRLKKDESKHVTFVSPVKNGPKERRTRKV